MSDTFHEETGGDEPDREEPASDEHSDPPPIDYVRASSHWGEIGLAFLGLGGFTLVTGFSSGGLDLQTAGWLGGVLIVLGLFSRWRARRSAATGD